MYQNFFSLQKQTNNCDLIYPDNSYVVTTALQVRLVFISNLPAKQQVLTEPSWKAEIVSIFSQKKKKNKLITAPIIGSCGKNTTSGLKKTTIAAMLWLPPMNKLFLSRYSIFFFFSMFRKTLLIQSTGPRKSDSGGLHHCGYVVNIVSSRLHATTLQTGVNVKRQIKYM